MASEEARFTTGNQAARKFTLEDTRKIFRSILAEIEGNEDIVYLNTALKNIGQYAKRINYLLRQYAYDEEVVEYSERIESLLEERLVTGSMKGRLREATAIFIMKAKLGMKETQHIHNTFGNQPDALPEGQNGIENATPEQLEEMQELLQKIAANNGEQNQTNQRRLEQ